MAQTVAVRLYPEEQEVEKELEMESMEVESCEMMDGESEWEL